VAKLARILKARERSGIEHALSEGDKDANKWILQATNHNFGAGRKERVSEDAKSANATRPEGRSSLAIFDTGGADGSNFIEVLSTWRYNVFEHDQVTLIKHCSAMWQLMGFHTTFNVHQSTMLRFTRSLMKQYKANSYHNFKHGVDVMQSVFHMSSVILADSHLSKLEIFATLTGALSHDVGHPGVTNAFLVNTNAPLAMRYNDISVLENLHCAIMFDTMGPYQSKGEKISECNLYGGLSLQDWIIARKTSISAILMTDNTHHFKCINDIKVMLEVHSDKHKRGQSIFKDTEKNRLFLCGLLLHVSDISNPLREWKTSSTAAFNIMEEFFKQGDQEKALGMQVSMLCDRDKENIPKSQMGFIDFFITPLAEQFFRLFPEAGEECASELVSNRAKWQSMYLEGLDETQRKTEEPVLQGKYEKFKGRFSEYLDTIKDLEEMDTSRRPSGGDRLSFLKRSSAGKRGADV